MVMIFQNPKARNQLLENGIVYTFRTKPHSLGKDWATDKRGGKKIADINIERMEMISGGYLIRDNTLRPLLLKYLKESGFDTISEWINVIKILNKKKNPEYAFVFKVTIIEYEISMDLKNERRKEDSKAILPSIWIFVKDSG